MQIRSNLIKSKDGKIYELDKIIKGKKTEVDPNVLLNYGYAPMSSIIKGLDGKIYDLIDILIARATGGGGEIPGDIQEQLNQISSQLSEITQEIKEARSDYFGKEHASLKAKEDSEFEFVHIDNSKGMFMPVKSETGAIKVENSIEGKTKDLTIKGRTLQNIWERRQYFGYSELLKNNTNYTIFNLNSRKIYYERNTIDVDGNYVYAASEQIEPHSSKVITLVDSKLFRSINLHSSFGWDSENIKTSEVLVLEGDWTNKEIPQYFEGIKSLGEEENKISILSCGKNLFNINNDCILDNGERYSDGIKQKNEGSLMPVFKINNLIIGKTYVITSDIEHLQEPISGQLYYCMQYKNGYYSADDKLSDSALSVNPNNKLYIQFTALKSEAFLIGGTRQNSFYNIQLQLKEETITTEYTPHQSDKKDILLPVSFGSKGIGNVCDEGYWNGDYLQNVDRVILDETITLVHYRNNKCVKVQSNTINNSNSTVICNKFNGVGSLVDIIDKDTIGMTAYNDGNPVSKGFYINFDKDVSLEEVRSLLLDTPTIIYYKLAEPILHKATTPTNNNLTTFKEITHVSCLNKISPSSIEAKFPVNVGATLSRLNEENKTLENENMELNKRLISKAIYFNEQTVDLATVDFETDFRLMEIEFALEIPINLNMKGMRNMAVRSPYDMAKIVILGGNYERADMEYKLSVYVKRGRMTQEEHDELIALMDAREIIQK